MRDAPGELAYRFHLLRLTKGFLSPVALCNLRLQPVESGRQIGCPLLYPLLQRFVQLEQPRLRLLGLSDVVCNSNKADMLAVQTPARLRFRA
jgi:hypothetical protein